MTRASILGFNFDTAKGGSGKSHCGGNAGTYRNVVEAIGKAMVKLLLAKWFGAKRT